MHQSSNITWLQIVLLIVLQLGITLGAMYFILKMHEVNVEVQCGQGERSKLS